ncbi:MAG: porin [Rhodomicrobium sp.]
MRKVLICALALGGFAASAHAADLSVDSMKDPLPEGPITYAGVTFYGTVDVGYGYNSNGAPPSGAFYPGEQYIMYSGKQNREAVSAITNNALSQSTIGAKIEEDIGYGFVAIGKLDTGFDPMSGELSNACASLVRNNGVATASQASGLDGSRCGQFLNGQAYGGVSNASYGTLTVGRHNSLDLDVENTYDPMGNSYALSMLGYSATIGGGIGDTETGRWDDSVKYIYQYGPAHVAGMYSSGGPDTSIWGNAYAANAGITWKGFSVDGVYTKENGAVSLGSLGANNIGAQTLAATVTDNEAWTVAGKYVYNFGGSFKDEDPGSKLTIFGGYQESQKSNSTDGYVGEASIGGYVASTLNNTPYAAGAEQTLHTVWTGAKYEMGPWAFTAAYYQYSQDNYLLSGASNTTCAEQTAHNISTGATGDKTGKNCAGADNEVSGLVDYTFNKHFDVYTGANWSNAGGGLANGFIGSSLDGVTVVSGFRLKF